MGFRHVRMVDAVRSSLALLLKPDGGRSETIADL